jgi:chemotaxis signal transduction protein
MDHAPIDDQEVPEEAPIDDSPAAQFVLFVAGQGVFALALPDVLEVIEPEWWVRIPHAAPWAEGLLYHHGDPLVVANAGALLGEERSPRGAAASVLRLRVPEMKIGIFVDRVLGTWRGTGPSVPCRETPFVRGVWERKGGVVNQIDFETLAERASRIFDK